MIYAYTRPRYQVSVYRTIGPLVLVWVEALRPSQKNFRTFSRVEPVLSNEDEVSFSWTQIS